MNMIESLGLVCFAGVFFLAYVAIFAAIAIITTPAKQGTARRILHGQARGTLADLETPNNRSRFRVLAVVALFGVVGFTCSIAVLALQSLAYYLNLRTEFSTLYWVTVGLALIFGSVAAVTGFLMQKEVNHRL